MPDIFDQLDESISVNPKAEKIAKQAKFYGWQPKPETIESIREPLMQKMVYPATEFTSSALGAPGDILSLLNEVIARPLSKALTGDETQPFEETMLGSVIPTSERLHKGIEEFAGEEIRPKSTTDELIGITAGFLGSALGLGAKGLGKEGVIPFTTKKIPASVNTVLNAFAPAAAFVGAKKADLPPWMQASAAIGTSLLSHRLTNKTLPQLNRDMYAKVDELAKDVMIPQSTVTDKLAPVKNLISKELSTGPISKIRGLIEEMETKSSGGAIPLSEVINWRQGIINASKEFEREVQKRSDKYWKSLRSGVDEIIDEYGKTNPEFNKTYREANSLYRGLKESRKIEDFLKSHKMISALGTAVGGVGAYFLKYLSALTGTNAMTGALAAKGILFTRAMVRNPGFRKAYKDLLKNAANENVRGTTRALKNFNKIGKKEGLNREPEEFDIFDQLD